MIDTRVKIVCGVDGCTVPVYGRTAVIAKKRMTAHRQSVHPNYTPPKGSMADRIPKLD